MRRFALVFVGAGAVVLALLQARPEASSQPAVPGPNDRIPAGTVATWLLDGESHFRLVDARSDDAPLPPGLEDAVRPAVDGSPEAWTAALPPDALLVVFGAGNEDALPAWRALRARRDHVLLMDGGVAAWKEQVLAPASPADQATGAEWARYRARLAVADRLLADRLPGDRATPRRAVTPVIRHRGPAHR